MKKAFEFLTARPANFFIVAALLWGGLMCFLNYEDGANFAWHDLLVEANGMVFDLLVFGVLLSVYEALREKKEKIERLHEEIDDYRGWDEKEAMYRIVGATKRLNKLGVSNIRLFSCYLQNANLPEINLQGASLWGANLEKTHLALANFQNALLSRANLHRANLIATNLKNTILDEANLSEAYLGLADLKGASLKNANLDGATFSMTNLDRVNMTGASFRGAKVLRPNLDSKTMEDAYSPDEEWFLKLGKWNVQGREEIEKKYYIDSKGVLNLR